jgi:UDP-3-O-[3-hydroxymyristoyl] N-acetylglucosamine deacetylase
MPHASCQTTIRNPVRFSHRALLSGKTTSVRLKPGPADSGIVFNGRIPARLANAFVEEHLVGLRQGKDTVLCVEHLLAACYGLGIDNLQVEVLGGEVPFGDGSALPFVRILQAAGRKELKVPCVTQSIVAPVVVSRADGFLCALPRDSERAQERKSQERGPEFALRVCAPAHLRTLTPTADCNRHSSSANRHSTASSALTVACFIRFPSKTVGEQSFDFSLSADHFARELGPAQTFGFWQEGKRMPGWLSRLGELHDGMLLPVKPRFPDEPVRHKTLDLLGDLCLLGRRLNARLVAYKAGHQLHHDFLKELEERWT